MKLNTTQHTQQRCISSIFLMVRSLVRHGPIVVGRRAESASSKPLAFRILVLFYVRVMWLFLSSEKLLVPLPVPIPTTSEYYSTVFESRSFVLGGASYRSTSTEYASLYDINDREVEVTSYEPKVSEASYNSGGLRNFDSCLRMFHTPLLPGEKQFRNLLYLEM